jgi:hypothetical protein
MFSHLRLAAIIAFAILSCVSGDGFFDAPRAHVEVDDICLGLRSFYVDRFGSDADREALLDDGWAALCRDHDAEPSQPSHSSIILSNVPD